MADQSTPSRRNIARGAATERDPAVHQTRLPRVFTVKQFSARNPAFSKGSLRWLLFSSRDNKLNAAVVRVGRRVLIDEDRFVAWVKEQQRHR